MKTETIVMCVVALLLGMLLYHMLKGVCGCKSVEGLSCEEGRGPTIGGGVYAITACLEHYVM